MLVLSRKKDESLIIGDDIIITVVEIRGDTVRLGIKAPSDVPVHRTEVAQAILRQGANSLVEEHSQTSRGKRRSPMSGKVSDVRNGGNVHG